MANASTPHNLSNKPRLDKLLLLLLVLQSAFVGPLNWPELHTVLGAGGWAAGWASADKPRRRRANEVVRPEHTTFSLFARLRLLLVASIHFRDYGPFNRLW